MNNDLTQHDDENMPLANQLRTLREAKGWSRKRLAEESGVTEGTIVNIEQSGADPKSATIKRMVIALGCTADELLFEDDEISADDQFKLMLSEIKKLEADDKEFIKEVLKATLTHCQYRSVNKL